MVHEQHIQWRISVQSSDRSNNADTQQHSTLSLMWNRSDNSLMDGRTKPCIDRQSTKGALRKRHKN